MRIMQVIYTNDDLSTTCQYRKILNSTCCHLQINKITNQNPGLVEQRTP